jgi:beta-galactosidase
MKQDYGFMLYRTVLSDAKSGMLKIKDLRDYGIVFVNGKRVGILDRRLYQDSLYLDLPQGKITLDILVENLGRINFGPYLLKNNKGITEKVLLGNQELTGWQMFSLPFENMDGLVIQGNVSQINTPVIRKGIFNLQKTGDTYLDMRSWGKGCVWVNGHNLGRYWEIGPQQTIYLPAEWLKTGQNEVIVFETLKAEQSTLQGLAYPILDQLK